LVVAAARCGGGGGGGAAGFMTGQGSLGLKGRQMDLCPGARNLRAAVM